MKRSILSIVIFIILVSNMLFAQIPNNGFENWTSMGSYSNPDNWDQLNSMTSFASVYTCTKGTPGNVGTAYLKLTSKTVTGLGVVPGIATTGTLNFASMSASGFAYSSRPQDFIGTWQYMSSGADVGFMAAYLTKWNVGMSMRDTIAIAYKKLIGMAMSWTAFTIPFTYISGANPDSAIIILSASGNTPVAGSYLYLDNMAFNGNVAGVKETENTVSHLSVYPNPASDKISIELTSRSANLKMQLIDISGRQIKEIVASHVKDKFISTINVEGMAKGIYFLKVMEGNSVEVKKIIIE